MTANLRSPHVFQLYRANARKVVQRMRSAIKIQLRLFNEDYFEGRDEV